MEIKKDYQFSLILIAISLMGVFVFGDVLYLSVYYYILFPFVAFLVSLVFKSKNYFLTGVCATIVLSYLPYLYNNLTQEHPDGLIGLGHLFSLIGFFSGLIIAGFYLKNSQKSSIKTGLISFLFTIIGFGIAQIILCNTFLYCGCFSLY